VALKMLIWAQAQSFTLLLWVVQEKSTASWIRRASDKRMFCSESRSLA